MQLVRLVTSIQSCTQKVMWLLLHIKYYMEESVLLGTKPLVDSIRHFIRDPSGEFSVCHLCECHIVQWRHNCCLLFSLNWFLQIIKEHYTLVQRYEFYVLMARTISHEACSCGKNNISLVRYCSCHENIKFISSSQRVISSVYNTLEKIQLNLPWATCQNVKLCWLVMGGGCL